MSLPGYEYTFRDQKKGGVFAGYADDLSLTHATIFVDVIGGWLKRYRKVEDIGAAHFQIPKMTYNADVEAFHRTVEEASLKRISLISEVSGR